MAKAKKKSPKKVTVDWSDEDSVKAAMARELDVGVDDLEIEEDRGLSSFGEGTVYRISSGRQEWLVAEDDDTAEKLAVAVVKQDLESEPEIFNQSFLERHIDLERLRRDLYTDTYDSNYERLKDEAERRPMEFMKENDIEIPEPTKKQMEEHAEAMSDDETPASEILKKLEGGDAEDKWIEMGEEPEVPDRAIEEVADSETNAQLKDPIDYLGDIYGREDAVKKAIEIAGIDEDAAAQAAVDEDGVGHFLARYDGNVNDEPGGIVYWREN